MSARILALVALVAGTSLLPQSAAAEPALDGGRKLAAAGKWTVFRSDKSERFKQWKCVGLHQDVASAVLLAELIAVTYEKRGAVVSYRLQINDEQPGAVQRAWAGPRVVGIGAQEFEHFLTLAPKRLRVHTTTKLGSVVDDLDLTGIKEAHAVIRGPGCK